jgi:limonene-1,2-epoxide hydrolase
MRDPNVEAAERYLNGLKQKDLSKVPFDPDVVFEGPLSPDKLHGAESLVEFLSGVFPIIKDVRVKRHIADGGHVCVLWELETSTPAAVIPICEYFRVADGLIKEMRPYYDPRPITNPTR